MRKFLFALIIITVFIALYFPVLTTYFSQDDFFHFKVSQTDGSANQFINLFGFHPFTQRGIAFYRPLFREALYNTSFNLFGLNPLPLRVVSLLIHLFNVWLVYFLMQQLFYKRGLSFLTAFFFSITPSNVAILYYLAGGIQALGATMFILLTLIFFMFYIKKMQIKYLLFSFSTFLLALGSHELAAVIPFLLIGIIFIQTPVKKTFTLLLKLLPYFIVLSIYLYLEITIIGFSSQEQQYRTIFNFKTTLNSLFWYLGWALGLPEMLIDFVTPGLKLNPVLMRYWGNYYTVIFATFFVLIISIALSIIYLFLKQKEALLNKRFIFFALWFPVGILPVIFLPQHKSTYYLASTLPAVWGTIGYLIINSFLKLKKSFPKLAMALFTVLVIDLLILTITSVRLQTDNFWAAGRGKLAESLVKDIKIKYPKLPKGASVYLANDPNYPFVAQKWGGTSKQAAFALNDDTALQLLYGDPKLQVLYEDLDGPLSNYPDKKIYPVTAIIP